MNTFELEVTPAELNLERCLQTGMVFRWRLSDGVWEGADGDNWYRLTHSGSRLTVETNGTRPQLERFLRLDQDTAGTLRELLQRGPELAPLLKAAEGLRVLRYADPVEAIFTFLCTANNHVKRISAMVERLAQFGEPLAGSPLVHFPDIGRLAAVQEEVLRGAGFGYRGASIPKVAGMLAERGGDAYIRQLQGEGYAAVRGELLSLPSIGPKLADCICLFGFGFNEAVPVDTHIWQAATRLYFPQHEGTPLSPHKYEEFTTFFVNRFGATAGWAQQILFFDNLLNWRSRKTDSKLT